MELNGNHAAGYATGSFQAKVKKKQQLETSKRSLVRAREIDEKSKTRPGKFSKTRGAGAPLAVLRLFTVPLEFWQQPRTIWPIQPGGIIISWSSVTVVASKWQSATPEAALGRRGVSRPWSCVWSHGYTTYHIWAEQHVLHPALLSGICKCECVHGLIDLCGWLKPRARWSRRCGGWGGLQHLSLWPVGRRWKRGCFFPRPETLPSLLTAAANATSPSRGTNIVPRVNIRGDIETQIHVC